MKRPIILLMLFSLMVSGSYAYYRFQRYAKESVPAAINISDFLQQGTANEQNVDTQNVVTSQAERNDPSGAKVTLAAGDKSLPPELNFKMEFYSQAPFGNWDFPWQEACEEASILLVANTYFNHNWTREQFNDQILKLVQWQNENFGDYKDSNIAAIQQMLKRYLGLESIIHENPNLDNIKQILAKGHLIVMPFAGKKLGNPNYTNGGPLYHVMVIKGYKEGDKVITHDVGTKNGADYVYNWKVLQNALHDFTIPIDNGAKRMIEILPPSSLTKPN